MMYIWVGVLCGRLEMAFLLADKSCCERLLANSEWADMWKAARTRPTAGGQWLGRWANGEGRGTVRKAARTRPTAGGRRLGRWANGEGRGTVRKAARTRPTKAP